MNAIDLRGLRTATFTSKDLSNIGEKIFFNETSRKIEKLIFWNSKEKFPSFGIAHFVWLPKDYKQSIPLGDVFSEFLTFCDEHKISLPAWLQSNRTCPWTCPEEFEETKTKDSEMIESVRDFLNTQKSIQAAFVVEKFVKALPAVIDKMREEDKDQAAEYCNILLNDQRGCFALIDYSSFKGFGLGEGSPAYNHQNWGLRQVIERVLAKDWRDNCLEFFIESAKETLANRITNAPIEQQPIEQSYILGWNNRLDRYRLEQF